MEILEQATFKVRNLGPLVEGGEFAVKPLTLFCGPNNTGKTWTMYSLCHLFQSSKRYLEFSNTSAPDGPSFSFNIVKGALSAFFNIDQDIFQKTEFEAVLKNGKKWSACLQEMGSFCDCFLIPAERNGLHLFFRELSSRRTALLHHASKKNIDIGKLLQDVISSPYATPIADYIDWLNMVASNHKTTTKKGVAEDIAGKKLQKDILHGKYSLDREGRISFTPYQSKRGKKYHTSKLALHMGSSTVKSFFGLWYYLTYQAEKGDVLMIDEPEINVHPENQRGIARLIASLVNKGLYCVISTHSDYLIRELNTLIMLNGEQDGTLAQKHKYSPDEILSPEKVGAYLFDGGKIKPFEIMPDDGIYATTFDKVISDLNNTNNAIHYALKDSGDER